ncbi:MFS general substrate transporter [Coniophora puteana RWD-64-598 SS2]|uniref:MFS general substrate transporter n=1 Tax=Coniophora puteana (strain RWD-64-598) TaxID=741705 RepID=A0A5M3N1C5_CONPW|nr:MFS general substrate transporter [Coniophora puteana RWD-64-598 SS2]EIW84681.1 MFS general substrate transporter [Coniophora puteana RWD-64-598 SS2]
MASPEIVEATNAPEPVRAERADDDRTLREQPSFDMAEKTEEARVEAKEEGIREQYGEPPDGGMKAYLVLLSTVLCTFTTFGFVNAWGIFQDYYEATLLKDENPSNIAWIGSIQYSLVFFPGLVTGRLFDLGFFKIPFFVASCVLVACTFLTAECTEYWHFLLCQGFALGLSAGVIFGPTLGVVSHWFKKKRGLALGITALGSSAGGTVFPVAAQNLLPMVGFKWTMRIFGFILIGCLGVGNLLIDRRLPPIPVKGGLLNLAAFRNKAYTMYCLSGLMTFLGLYTVLTYIPVSATLVGVSPNFALYLVAIANASSALGRILAGYFADRVGAITIMTPFTVVAGVLTFAWPFARTQGSLIAVAVIYGGSCGAYVSLCSAPAILMGETGDVGRRVGMFFTISAVGAVAGPPISGAINSATGGFEDVGWYAGGTVMLSAVMLLATKYLHTGSIRGRF